MEGAGSFGPRTIGTNAPAGAMGVDARSGRWGAALAVDSGTALVATGEAVFATSTEVLRMAIR